MRRYLYYLMIGVGAALMAGKQAQAAPCADYGLVVQRLAAIYGESRRIAATAPDARVVEVFVAPLTGSWTLTSTGADGIACLIAAGQAFDWHDHWLAVLQRAA